jgi:hypothetical protein
MKLPRWLVISMLTTSVLSVLGFGGWWWVTWPERTAREFLDLMARGDRTEAQKLLALDSTAQLKESHACFMAKEGWVDLQPNERSVADYARATARFRVAQRNWTLKVERGRITEPQIIFGSDQRWVGVIPSRAGVIPTR